ncbi:MAG: CsbD family protein, partial [Actinomycetota bacterium]
MGATGDQLKGHGKEAAGLILGNEQLEAEGRHDREVGEAEAKIDKVERKAPLPPKTGPDLFGGERAQPARREAELTIRGDQRQQVMPGMEPSARQAQAARDAAGPRSGQKPADEGLFGRKEPEQPPLRPTRPAQSVFLSPRSTDLLRTIPEGGNPNVVSRDWVLDNGKRTGFEYLTAVHTERGDIVNAVTSNKTNAVDFNLQPVRLLPDKSLVFHHNHPNESSFSLQDLMIGQTPQISHTVVHAGPDLFVATIPDQYKIPTDWTRAELDLAQENYLARYKMADGHMADFLSTLYHG